MPIFIPIWTLVPPPSETPLLTHARSFSLLSDRPQLTSFFALSSYQTTPILTFPALSSVNSESIKLFAASFRASILVVCLPSFPLILSFILPEASNTKTISLSFWVVIVYGLPLTVILTLALLLVSSPIRSAVLVAVTLPAFGLASANTTKALLNIDVIVIANARNSCATFFNFFITFSLLNLY